MKAFFRTACDTVFFLHCMMRCCIFIQCLPSGLEYSACNLAFDVANPGRKHRKALSVFPRNYSISCPSNFNHFLKSSFSLVRPRNLMLSTALCRKLTLSKKQTCDPPTWHVELLTRRYRTLPGPPHVDEIAFLDYTHGQILQAYQHKT